MGTVMQQDDTMSSVSVPDLGMTVLKYLILMVCTDDVNLIQITEATVPQYKNKVTSPVYDVNLIQITEAAVLQYKNKVTSPVYDVNFFSHGEVQHCLHCIPAVFFLWVQNIDTTAHNMPHSAKEIYHPQ